MILIVPLVLFPSCVLLSQFAVFFTEYSGSSVFTFTPTGSRTTDSNGLFKDTEELLSV